MLYEQSDGFRSKSSPGVTLRGFIFDFLLKSSNWDQIGAVVRGLESEQFKYQEVKAKYDAYSPQMAHKMRTFVLT